MRGAWAIVALVAILPNACAQAHEHGDAFGVVIAHDAPADGTAFVGNLAHFSVLDMGDDAVPDFHQQNHIRVSENGVVLFETTPDSGHDYDGVVAFDLAFPVPGTYLVEALDESGKVLASFGGTVQPAPQPQGGSPTLDVEAEGTATAGMPATFRFAVRDESGQALPHTDSMFEVWQGTDLLLRTHTHTHEEPQEVAYTFAAAGDYTVRIVAFQAYPDADAARFAPLVVERSVAVAPGAPRPGPTGAPPAPPPLPEVPLTNAVRDGEAGPEWSLVGTYDPYTSVGTMSQMRLSALVVDAAGHPVPHVNFQAVLHGPMATGLAEAAPVFASNTLHEYDGILEVASRQPIPGHYSLEVAAQKGNWTGTLDLPFDVLPPGPGLAAGVQVYTLSGHEALAAGTTANFELAAAGPAGTPFMHSEVFAQVRDDAGIPVWSAKLHTHDDGLFAWGLALPTAGDYTLRLSPFPLDGSLTPAYYGSDVGGAMDFALSVGAGPGIPVAIPEPIPAPAAVADAAPGASVALVGLVALLAAVVRRRLA